MSSAILYRGENGGLAFVNRVLDEFEYLEEFGHFPGPAVQKRRFGHDPEGRQTLAEHRRRRTYEKWSARLAKDRWRCDDCHRPVRKGGGLAPMFQHRAWAKIASHEEWLCDRCARRRLGRPICLHDLMVCLFNVERWRWLDGPKWRGVPSVNYNTLPPNFFDMTMPAQAKLLQAVQKLALHFDVPVAIMSANIVSIVKRNLELIDAKRESQSAD